MDVQRLLITLKRKAKTLEKLGSLFKTSLNFLEAVVKRNYQIWNMLYRIV